MDQLVAGRKTLLVGEGDFSFCVSLVEKCGDTPTQVTATSLETRETIKKHKYAEENIQVLVDKGVKVVLDTDATQLHINPVFCHQTFSCIIFNFPHAGGKSNHKKNRKLLNDFFLSAVQVLADRGQILMTLCKGQGGTPADKPRRAWHDSWQVVSMAANAGLVLVNILPFNVEEYSYYTSTGFRSLDKGFHTDNALTHVLETAPSVLVPSNTDCVPVLVQQTVFLSPRYLHAKLTQIRSVNNNPNHPVHQIYHMLKQEIATMAGSKSTGSAIDDDLWFPLVPWHQTETGEKDQHREPVVSSLRNRWSLYRATSQSHENGPLIDFTDLVSGTEQAGNHLHLVSNPVECVISSCKSCGTDKKLTVMYGPVLERNNQGKISMERTSVSYRMCVMIPVSNNLDKVFQLRDKISSFIFKLTDSSEVKESDYTPLASDCSVGTEKMKLIGNLHVNTCSKQEQFVSSGDDIETSTTELCTFYVYKEGSEVSLLCYIDVWELACQQYHVEDRRLLWSADPKILDQYTSLDRSRSQIERSRSPVVDLTDSINGIKIQDMGGRAEIRASVRKVSLYPMTFTHDMSFWEIREQEFNESEYCEIIRDVAGDCVVAVAMIDRYTDGQTGRTSRCYRLVFQSCDLVLSYNTSWRLQSVIRLEVEKYLGITLR